VPPYLVRRAREASKPWPAADKMIRIRNVRFHQRGPGDELLRIIGLFSACAAPDAGSEVVLETVKRPRAPFPQTDSGFRLLSRGQRWAHQFGPRLRFPSRLAVPVLLRWRLTGLSAKETKRSALSLAAVPGRSRPLPALSRISEKLDRRRRRACARASAHPAASKAVTHMWMDFSRACLESARGSHTCRRRRARRLGVD